MTPKLIFYLIALVAAFVFTFFAPGIEYFDQIIVVLGSVAGFFGVTEWRATYQKAVVLFKSKTIWGAVIVAVPMIFLVIEPLFVGYTIPQVVKDILFYLVSGGGGLTLYGIFDATKK